MAVDAVVAVVPGAEAMWRRSTQLHRLAVYHARAEASFRRSLAVQSRLVEEAERLTSGVTRRWGNEFEIWVLASAMPAAIGPDWALAARNLPVYRSGRDRYAAAAAYHVALRGKYERSATRPWLAVAPDPPPP
jgi:hypothetical protein